MKGFALRRNGIAKALRYKSAHRRLSENRLLLRPAVNTDDLRWQTQNALNVGYRYISGRFGLAVPAQSPGSSTCPRNFRLVSRRSHSRTASQGATV